jgi:ammonium transporter Rh
LKHILLHLAIITHNYIYKTLNSLKIEAYIFFNFNFIDIITQILYYFSSEQWRSQIEKSIFYTFLCIVDAFYLRIFKNILHRSEIMKKSLMAILAGITLTFVMPFSVFAESAGAVDSVRQVQQYNFSINILAMLLVGFGFLMVFVKKYGYSATTGTYLVVGAGIPLYLLLRYTGVISSEAVNPQTIKALLLSEFAVAAALIAMGAVLGRLKVYQYAFISIFIVPIYMLNEWLVLDGGLGVTKGFVDAAGSIIIHAFGAYFGLGLAVALTRKNHMDLAIECDDTSDRFSMLGSMVLWIFWPSFCSAIVPEADFEKTVVNTILALCGATVITYIFSALLRKGKPSIADIANASLSGGVAIGATCNLVSAPVAFLIGLLAGSICVIGYTVIQPRLQKLLKMVDTCGVHNLHGMPGLLGGIIAIFVVPEAAKAQVIGILFTIVLAFIGGAIAGNIIRLTGSKEKVYEDSDEFAEG